MYEIRTCQELIDFFSDETTEDIDATLMNDIDFADYGQIMSGIEYNNQRNLHIDLNGKTILNIYPVLCCFLKGSNGNESSHTLTIENGKIENLLANFGAFIYDNYTSNSKNTTYTELFTSFANVKFKNVAFSVLGCNFYDESTYYTALLTTRLKSSCCDRFKFCFENCSFYIKVRNALPLVSFTVFKNCSFYFDAEYDGTYYGGTSGNNNLKSTVFYFCVLKGKIRKSENFTPQSDSYPSNTLGHLINCYVDVETDIPNLFISAKLSKTLSNYSLVERYTNDYKSHSNVMEFGGDSVYNADKYTATIDAGETNELIIGGQALTTAQMNDADYLLNCGFLAINDSVNGDV